MSGAQSNEVGALSIASAIRELRLRLGETQLQFAVRNKFALSTLTRYEAGVQRPKPGILKIFRTLADGRFPDLVIAFNTEMERRARDGSHTQMLRRQGAPIRSATFHGQLQRLLLALDKQESTVNGLRDVIARMINDWSVPEISSDAPDHLLHGRKRTKKNF